MAWPPLRSPSLGARTGGIPERTFGVDNQWGQVTGVCSPFFSSIYRESEADEVPPGVRSQDRAVQEREEDTMDER